MALVDNKTKIQALIDGINALPDAGSGETIMLQEKTATPTKETQSITPDTGYNGLSKVDIEPIPAEYIIPTGELSITGNGTHDVAAYASVNVAVESGGSSGVNVKTCNIVIEGSADYIQLGYTKLTENGLEMVWEDTTRTFTNAVCGTIYTITVEPDEENLDKTTGSLKGENGGIESLLKLYEYVYPTVPSYAEDGGTITFYVEYA